MKKYMVTFITFAVISSGNGRISSDSEDFGGGSKKPSIPEAKIPWFKGQLTTIDLGSRIAEESVSLQNNGGSTKNSTAVKPGNSLLRVEGRIIIIPFEGFSTIKSTSRQGPCESTNNLTTPQPSIHSGAENNLNKSGEPMTIYPESPKDLPTAGNSANVTAGRESKPPETIPDGGIKKLTRSKCKCKNGTKGIGMQGSEPPGLGGQISNQPPTPVGSPSPQNSINATGGTEIKPSGSEEQMMTIDPPIPGGPHILSNSINTTGSPESKLSGSREQLMIIDPTIPVGPTSPSNSLNTTGNPESEPSGSGEKIMNVHPGSSEGPTTPGVGTIKARCCTLNNSTNSTGLPSVPNKPENQLLQYEGQVNNTSLKIAGNKPVSSAKSRCSLCKTGKCSSVSHPEAMVILSKPKTWNSQ